MSTPVAELKDRLELALRLAQAARSEILPRFNASAVRNKPDGSEVTDADLAAETAMRTMLAATCSNDAVLGEEFGGENVLDAERSWILDPIDGTQAFALGLPTFGVLIAYAERGEALVGVMSFPALGYDVYAARSLGCFKRPHGGGAAVASRVSAAKHLSLAQVSATSLQQSSAVVEGGLNLSGVVTSARRFRFVGDCLQHALVCMGRLDAAIDLIVAPWDVAAIVPCVEEAGGVVSDAAGQRGQIVASGSLISASGHELKTEIANALQAC